MYRIAIPLDLSSHVPYHQLQILYLCVLYLHLAKQLLNLGQLDSQLLLQFLILPLQLPVPFRHVHQVSLDRHESVMLRLHFKL